MTQKIPVLIIGAGPTGLMMASQLAIHNVPFLIVDKDSRATSESRAIGLQARSLEIFSQMGIVDTFLKGGQAAKGINFVVNGKVKQHVPLSSFGQELTEYPYVFMHEQSKTEANFIDFLKKHEQQVVWNTEVLSLVQDGDEVLAVLKNKSGKEEKIMVRWVIGADGAHSLVRHTLGIPFIGKTYKQSLFVLDCLIETDIPKDELAVMFSDHYFAALFPMANHRWRIVGELPVKLSNKEDITFEDVNKDFAKRMQADITLSDPSWIAMYHSHHRCVETFHKDNFFLLGDAAHIHSPVGAQGMNTGLQDAYNLAWKLAYVYSHKAKSALLDTLTAERITFAHKLVKTTDRLFSVIVSSNKFETFFRLHVAPKFIHFLINHKKTSRFMFRTVSQIGINYRHGPLAINASFGKFPKDLAEPGDRLPYILFTNEKEKSVNMQKLITPEKFHLFYFSGKRGESSAVLESVKKYSYIEVTTIPLLDGTKDAYKLLGVKERGFYLIRPDMYIAYRSLEDNADHFENYLNTYFIPD